LSEDGQIPDIVFWLKLVPTIDHPNELI